MRHAFIKKITKVTLYRENRKKYIYKAIFSCYFFAGNRLSKKITKVTKVTDVEKVTFFPLTVFGVYGREDAGHACRSSLFPFPFV